MSNDLVLAETWLKKELAQLIAEARKQNMWLWTPDHDIWFSPKELENAEGKFLWRVMDFQLRSPTELLALLDEKIRKLAAERQKVIERMLS